MSDCRVGIVSLVVFQRMLIGECQVEGFILEHAVAHAGGPFLDLGADVASDDQRPRSMMRCGLSSAKNRAIAVPERMEWVPMSWWW